MAFSEKVELRTIIVGENEPNDDISNEVYQNFNNWM
jgi:hypothetical protein